VVVFGLRVLVVGGEVSLKGKCKSARGERSLRRLHPGNQCPRLSGRAGGVACWVGFSMAVVSAPFEWFFGVDG